MPLPSLQEVAACVPPTGILRDWLRWSIRETEAPLIQHVGVALQVMTSLLPGDFGILYAGGSMLPATIRWTLIVGEPAASAKSTCVEMAINAIREVAANRICAAPDSPEGLVQELVENDGLPKILGYEELGEFLSKTQTGRLEPLKPLLTKLYDGRPHDRRLVHEPITVMRPRLSLFCGIAPMFFERYMTPTDLGGGFASRFQMICGTPLDPIPWPTRDQVRRVRLLERLQAVAETPFAPCSGLTPEAEREWTAFYLETHAMAQRRVGPIRGVYSRSRQHALKAALVYAVDLGEAGTDPWPLSLHALELGIRWAWLTTACAEHILGDLCASPHLRNRRTVLQRLAQGPKTKGDLAREVRLPQRQLDDLLTGLVTEDVVVVVTGTKLWYVLRDPALVAAEEDASRAASFTPVAGLPTTAAVASVEDADEGLPTLSPEAAQAVAAYGAVQTANIDVA